MRQTGNSEISSPHHIIQHTVARHIILHGSTHPTTFVTLSDITTVAMYWYSGHSVRLTHTGLLASTGVVSAAPVATVQCSPLSCSTGEQSICKYDAVTTPSAGLVAAILPVSVRLSDLILYYQGLAVSDMH